MKSEPLPGLDAPVSFGVLGTMNFGDTVDEKLASEMLDSALEAGITVIDTANAYSGGACETMLGRLLSNRTEKFNLATKVGIPHADGDGAAPLSRSSIERSLEGSLRRLNRDKVELYYLHAPDRNTDTRETLETLLDLYEQGKFDAWGFSNYSAWQALELVQRASEIGLPKPIIGQQLYNAVSRKIEAEYLEFSGQYGLHLMVYNPLAGGILSGNYKFESAPESGRFGSSKLAEMYKKRYWTTELFAAIEEFKLVAQELGITLPELAFRWLISKDAVGSILIGASSHGQLAANLSAMSAPSLDQEIVGRCDEIGLPLFGPMANYNR